MKHLYKLFCEFLGEAMQIKKIIFISFLVPFMNYSQDINELTNKLNINSLNQISDTELKSYWSKVQTNGYNLDQIKTIARSQGVSEFEIMEFEKRIQNLSAPNNDTNLSIVQSNNTSSFGLKPSQNIKSQNLKVFGSSFFNNPNISTAPNLNIATPDSYELGPGDELSISIWGAAENEYASKITREGYLKIERVGPVYLSGLSISEAKTKLKNELSKIYSGINSNYNKVFFDLTLLNSRSIIVNITGSVVAPGTYTLSSLINPLNALYAAGGPNANGSFREVKIIRGGKEIYSVDLYDYFVKGALENFSLRDQDVILVPSYKKHVSLRGEFKTNGIFELKENETISDLLIFNGGITSSGVKKQLYIERVDGFFKKILTANKKSFSDFILNDGDLIEARKVGDEIKNSVSVEGAIMVPGNYELNKNLNVKTLIESAGGLKENALKTRAYIVREENGLLQKALTVDLDGELDKLVLKNNDKLIIASIEDMTPEKNVVISGEINEPNVYPYFKGMTIVDLIIMAKGIKQQGSNKNIMVYRSTYDKTQQNPVKIINVSLNDDYVNLDSNQNIMLEVNDNIIIRSKPGYKKKEFVLVTGLVNKPGYYAIKNNTYSVFDIIKDFEGFLPDAELDGVKIKRPININLIEKLTPDLEGDSLDIAIDEFIEIGLNIDKILKSSGKENQFNLVLKDGDEIIVPKFDNSVEISGQIQQPTALSFFRGLTTNAAINKAGGFAPNAKKSNVYIIYQNGSVASTKSFLFFKSYPKLKPGCRVFVPKKLESENKTSIAEIVGYTTSLVSIVALINSL